MLAFSAALFGVLAGVVFGWPGKAKDNSLQIPPTIEPTIVSKTSAIAVLQAELTTLGSNQLLTVKLQNVSGRDIKAFSIANGKSWMTRNYMLTDESFVAGATHNQIIPVTADGIQGLKSNGKNFTIAAVYFADGKGDGLPVYVSRLADQWAGIRDQASRILPCLSGLSRRTPSQRSQSACESEALNLPVKADGMSSDYEGGLENAKREVLSQLKVAREEAKANRFVEAAAKEEKLTRRFQELAGSKR